MVRPRSPARLCSLTTKSTPPSLDSSRGRRNLRQRIALTFREYGLQSWRLSPTPANAQGRTAAEPGHFLDGGRPRIRAGSLVGLTGAVEKTRTSTGFRPQRPQRCASTSSATTAHHDGPDGPAPGRSGRLAKLFGRCKRASPLLFSSPSDRNTKARTCALSRMSPNRLRSVTIVSRLWRQTVIESP